MKRISPSMIVASLALFLSVGGAGAFAATHYQITSIHQIAPRVRHELRGTPGPAGPAGRQGPAGPAGATGATGATGARGFAAQSVGFDTQTAFVTSVGQTLPSNGTPVQVTASCPITDLAVAGGYQELGAIITAEQSGGKVGINAWVVTAHLDPGYADEATTPARVTASATCVA